MARTGHVKKMARAVRSRRPPQRLPSSSCSLTYRNGRHDPAAAERRHRNGRGALRAAGRRSREAPVLRRQATAVRRRAGPARSCRRRPPRARRLRRRRPAAGRNRAARPRRRPRPRSQSRVADVHQGRGRRVDARRATSPPTREPRGSRARRHGVPGQPVDPGDPAQGRRLARVAWRGARARGRRRPRRLKRASDGEAPASGFQPDADDSKSASQRASSVFQLFACACDMPRPRVEILPSRPPAGAARARPPRAPCSSRSEPRPGRAPAACFAPRRWRPAAGRRRLRLTFRYGGGLIPQERSSFGRYPRVVGPAAVVASAGFRPRWRGVRRATASSSARSCETSNTVPGKGLERGFERLTAFEVEVVRRLVENEEVRAGRDDEARATAASVRPQRAPRSPAFSCISQPEKRKRPSSFCACGR